MPDEASPSFVLGAIETTPLELASAYTVLATPGRVLEPRTLDAPEGVVTLYVDTETGLLVRKSNRRARPEVFRRGALPRRDRFWRSDEPAEVIR